MLGATERLAILKCKDFNPLFDLIEDLTKDFKVKECISKSDNTCFIVEASVNDNIKIYELLNNLEVDGDFLDCRFVDPAMEFKSENEILKSEISKSEVYTKKNESELLKLEDITKQILDTKSVELSHQDDKKEDISFDLYDPRFKEMYTDDDFIIDTSHDDYKKCGLLKYFIEAKRNYK